MRRNGNSGGLDPVQGIQQVPGATRAEAEAGEKNGWKPVLGQRALRGVSPAMPVGETPALEPAE